MKHRRFHAPAHPSATRGRLSRRREALVHVIFGVVWGSGAAWLVVRYFARQVGEFGELPNPLEAWWLRAHGASAFASLWLLGVLWAVHVVPAWKARRRASGIVLTGIAALLVVTGYLLYYVGGDDARAWIAWLHWVMGLALPVPFLVHALRRRTPRNAAAARESGDPQDRLT